MKWKLVFCIGMGVAVAHLAVFMFLIHLRPDPPAPEPPVPPNFDVQQRVISQSPDGSKVVLREITVSTKLAEPTPAPRKK